MLLAGLAAYLFMHPEARLDASGLRILWQLAKAAAPAVVLGAGLLGRVFASAPASCCCTAASGCLMFSELYTAQQAVEGADAIAEGETAY